jgi:hypothetical protein
VPQHRKTQAQAQLRSVVRSGGTAEHRSSAAKHESAAMRPSELLGLKRADAGGQPDAGPNTPQPYGVGLWRLSDPTGRMVNNLPPHGPEHRSPVRFRLAPPRCTLVRSVRLLGCTGRHREAKPDADPAPASNGAKS